MENTQYWYSHNELLPGDTAMQSVVLSHLSNVLSPYEVCKAGLKKQSNFILW
jgi:hypothetical protein